MPWEDPSKMTDFSKPTGTHLSASSNPKMDAKQLSRPNISEAHMKSADVLLILDDGAAIPCHSQILSMHSAVLCNMLEDLAASQHHEKVKVPLPNFTQEQCLALLAYLCNNGVSSEGAAFVNHLDAAADLARFAHAYDAPHALRQMQAYLVASMSDQHFSVTSSAGHQHQHGESKSCSPSGRSYDQTVLDWALMADKYDMHELRGHCDRAMAMHWRCYQDRPELLNQMSSSALQRIAKGLNEALFVTAAYHEGSIKEREFPDAHKFIAWGQHEEHEQPTEQFNMFVLA